MTQINFSRNGDALYVEFSVRVGVLAASYSLSLVEAGSVHIIATYTGDNQSIDDDKFILPKPATVNDSRKLDWTVVFNGLDLSMSPSYEFNINLYQGNTKIGQTVSTGTLSGSDQYANGLIVLKAV